MEQLMKNKIKIEDCIEFEDRLYFILFVNPLISTL